MTPLVSIPRQTTTSGLSDTTVKIDRLWARVRIITDGSGGPEGGIERHTMSPGPQLEWDSHEA